MGRRAWITASSEFVSHRVHLEGVYATASATSGSRERSPRRELTDKAIRRGIFQSVPDLIDTIQAYLAAHNENPKPFQWTATAEQILEKVRRGRVSLDAIAS